MWWGSLVSIESLYTVTDTDYLFGMESPLVMGVFLPLSPSSLLVESSIPDSSDCLLRLQTQQTQTHQSFLAVLRYICH